MSAESWHFSSERSENNKRTIHGYLLVSKKSENNEHTSEVVELKWSHVKPREAPLVLQYDIWPPTAPAIASWVGYRIQSTLVNISLSVQTCESNPVSSCAGQDADARHVLTCSRESSWCWDPAQQRCSRLQTSSIYPSLVRRAQTGVRSSNLSLPVPLEN